MSFIYDDKNLINELLKSALDFKLKFTKEGQDAAAQATKTVNADFANLETLLSNLEKSANPTQDPAPDTTSNVSYEGEGPAPKLTATNLENLGALCTWLEANKMTVGGQRVVYRPGEDPPPGGAWRPFKLEGNAGLQEVADRSMVKNSYHINKDLLVAFIVSRQAALAKKPNKVEEVQLGDLIAESNRLLRTKIPEKYTEPEHAESDTTKLDTVPNPFDPKNELAPGTELLLVRDLKTPEAFNAWTQKVSLKGKDGQVVSIRDKAWDKCYFIQGLYERSKVMSDRAIPADKKRMAYYAKMVEQLAAQSNCKLEGSQQQNNSQAPKVSGQQINQVISALPFVPKFVDFTKIERFFKVVGPVLSHVPQAASHIAEVTGLMQQFSDTYMENKDRVISTSLSVNQWANMMKKKDTSGNPVEPGRLMQPAIDTLAKIIDSTRAVVDLFWSQYGDRIPEEQQNLVIEQIGQEDDSTSRYSDNANGLMRMRGTISTRSNK